MTNPNHILLLMLSCLAVCVASTDIYIPNLPEMVGYFSSTENLVQMSISAAIIGSAFSTPVIGALSDTHGRRPIVFISLFVFALTTLGGGFSSTITELLIWRFVQGASGVAVIIMCGAIIADISKGRETGIRFALLTTTITTSLVLAPLAGGYLGALYDWRLCFWVLCVFGFAGALATFLFLPETHKERHPFSLSSTIRKYATMLTHKRFVVLCSIPALLIGGHIGFIACATFYFKENLGYNQQEFGEIQSLMMVFNAISSFAAAYFIKIWGEYKTVFWGLVVSTFGAIIMVLAAFYTPMSDVWIAITFTIYGIGLGLAMPPLTGEAMVLFPQSRGIAAAAMGILRSVLMAGMLVTATIVYTGHIIQPVLLTMALILVVVGFYIWLFATRKVAICEDHDHQRIM